MSEARSGAATPESCSIMAPTVEPVVDCCVVGLDAGFGPLAARLWGSYEENLCPFGEFDEVADVDDVLDSVAQVVGIQVNYVD
jgi:hypothetical protein